MARASLRAIVLPHFQSPERAGRRMMPLAMTYERVRPNTPLLWALIIPAAAYLAWQYYWPGFTGDDLVDGMTGIVLGLFICSRPAANGIDLIFLERGAFKRIVSNRSGVAWFLLNGFVMLLGWFVISVGAARLTPPVPQRPAAPGTDVSSF
jgi:hypothetical protein